MEKSLESSGALVEVVQVVIFVVRRLFCDPKTKSAWTASEG
jgi:hypothetical protein